MKQGLALLLSELGTTISLRCLLNLLFLFPRAAATMARWTFCFTLFALLPTIPASYHLQHMVQIWSLIHTGCSLRVSPAIMVRCILFVIYSGFYLLEA